MDEDTARRSAGVGERPRIGVELTEIVAPHVSRHNISQQLTVSDEVGLGKVLLFQH